MHLHAHVLFLLVKTIIFLVDWQSTDYTASRKKEYLWSSLACIDFDLDDFIGKVTLLRCTRSKNTSIPINEVHSEEYCCCVNKRFWFWLINTRHTRFLVYFWVFIYACISECIFLICIKTLPCTEYYVPSQKIWHDNGI